MPEESTDHHLELSSRLSNSSQTGRDWLELELFLLSNNFFSNSSDYQDEKTLLLNDKLIMKMFKQSGWNNASDIRVLLWADEPTAHAITEKLFASAVRSCDLAIVDMMLDAGMDAEATVYSIPGGPLSALQIASTHTTPEVMLALLSHGADVNHMFNGCSALYIASHRKNNLGMQILLDNGATTASSLLTQPDNNKTIGLVNDLTGLFENRMTLTRAILTDDIEKNKHPNI